VQAKADRGLLVGALDAVDLVDSALDVFGSLDELFVRAVAAPFHEAVH